MSRKLNSDGVPENWQWYHDALIEIRDRLLDDCASQLADVATPLEATGSSQADVASDEYDCEVTLTRLEAERDLLDEVDKALRRIHSGAYGICELTGKPIPKARLKAVPWTRYRVEALEQQPAIEQPRFMLPAAVPLFR